MKRIVFIILSVLMIILLSSCGNNNISDSSGKKNETTASSGPTSTTTSAATTKKLNVSVPDGWKKVEGSVLEHQYMKNTASFMVKTEKFYKNTLDDVFVEAESIFQKTFNNYKVVSTENIKVAGTDAKKLVFTCNVGNISMKYMYVYFFVGSDTYAVTFGDMASTFDGLSADYNIILNSMTIS